jgi:hypothetical protein
MVGFTEVQLLWDAYLHFWPDYKIRVTQKSNYKNFTQIMAQIRTNVRIIVDRYTESSED